MKKAMDLLSGGHPFIQGWRSLRELIPGYQL